MATPIVTGANVLRSRTVLSQADIFGLTTTPVLLAPAIPGKSLVWIDFAQKYIYGTTPYAAPSFVSHFVYGTGAGGVIVNTRDCLKQVLNMTTVNMFRFIEQQSVAASALSDVQGLGIYVVRTAGDITSGDGTVEIDLLYQAI